jgi:serine/tyrosine/threonine adenylyltransferase
MRFGFQHSYGSLPDRFHVRLAPTRVADPRLVVFNSPLALELGLDAAALEANAAAVFSGNELPEDADPLAMAYAGHQFGHLQPQLGDGRAILLGELRDRDGRLRDVQLKGSGRTPFSRTADGRAALGPMLREYLISEAMHALGIPTTRSLAVVTTGEPVRREDVLPGAVLTRIAASHVRVGTFEYFGVRGDVDAVRQLIEYVIERHYPEARGAENPPLAVLQAVVARQAKLIAQWMLVGFIHGVMNTDNMAISGETIDYGPCAFMDEYDPMTVFSSIDHRGRYAYGRQPAIAQWNLARFAETLVPLIHENSEDAVRLATAAIEPVFDLFDAHYLDGLRRKVGFTTAEPIDTGLIKQLLAAMQSDKVDFTLAFRHLAAVAAQPVEAANGSAFRSLFPQDSAIDAWLPDYHARLASEPLTPAARAAAMLAVNPLYIPRNHRVEAALNAASERGDLQPFNQLLLLVQNPFEERAEGAGFEQPAASGERVMQTFCGT